MNVKIFVMPRPNVRDPQSEAVLKELKRQNFPFSNLTLGKIFEFEVSETDKAAVQKRMETLADKFLANPNVETFRVKIN